MCVFCLRGCRKRLLTYYRMGLSSIDKRVTCKGRTAVPAAIEYQRPIERMNDKLAVRFEQ